jgi:hypothetical protein
VCRRVAEDSCLGEVLQELVKPQKRGFKDDEKMQPYTEAGLEKLTLLMRPTRTSVRTYLCEQEMHGEGKDIVT